MKLFRKNNPGQSSLVSWSDLINYDWKEFDNQPGFEKNQILTSLKSYVPPGLLKSYFMDLPQWNEKTQCCEITPHLLRDFSASTLDYLGNQFLQYNYLNSENRAIFRNIMRDISQIHYALKPLAHFLGFRYDMGIAGGCLRDLVNQRPIKDIDLIISLHYVPGFNIFSDIMNEDKTRKTPDQIFREAYPHPEHQVLELNLPAFVYNETKKTSYAEQFFFHVFLQTLKKHFHISKEYEPRAVSNSLKERLQTTDLFKSQYKNAFLRGVIKIEDEALHFPLDILLANSTVSQYVHSFDFEICKIWLDCSQGNMLDDLIMYCHDEKLARIYQNIQVCPSFIEDSKNKTLTLDPTSFDLNSAEVSLMKHYPRLKAKFSDYELKIIHYDHFNRVSEEAHRYIKAFFLHEKLNGQLPQWDESEEIKKVSKI
jgi:hypothetical protein